MAVRVIGHRGASAAFRENTLEAFVGAAALGADWVELDVHLSSDGVAVVHHDPSLADGRAIGALVATELPAHLPTLAAALAVCHQHGLGVNVEIKSDPRRPDFDAEYTIVDTTLASIQASLAGSGPDGAGRFLITSFDPGCIALVRDRSTIPTGQLVFDVGEVGALVDRVVAAGHTAVNPWEGFVDGTFMAAARLAGLEVYPWTVDDPERMRSLIDLGVDGIITNVPDLLRSLAP